MRLSNQEDLVHHIYALCKEYAVQHEQGFNTFSEVIGALQEAETKFNRDVVTPYAHQAEDSLVRQARMFIGG